MKQHELLEAVPASASLYLDQNKTGAYLQALFEDSPVATVALDSQHRFVICNPAFQQLFQFSTEELRAAHLDDLITDPETETEAKSLSRLVLLGEKVHTVSRRRRRDGMILDVEIYGIPLMVDGQLSGVYAVYQDVTERNRAQVAYRQLTHRIDNLQQEERRRVARDLHDSTSQELAALNWNLTLLQRKIGDRDGKLKELVMQTKEIAAQCSSSIRSATYLLHPPMLGEDGLHRVVHRMGAELEERSGLQVTVKVPQDLGRFPEDVEVAIFRVLQEALANVLRHSGSPAVQLSLQRQSHSLTLVVSDEGRRKLSRQGSGADTRAGVGISGMRERLEELGGNLVIHQDEHGTTIVGMLPVEPSPNV